MNSTRPLLRAAGALLSVCAAFAFWSGPSLTAAPQRASTNTTVAKKISAKSRKPLLRALTPNGRRVRGDQDQEDFDGRNNADGQPIAQVRREPNELLMRRADTFDGDLRSLPQTVEEPLTERPEREGPRLTPTFAGDHSRIAIDTEPPVPSIAESNAPAPPPSSAFDGLDFSGFGNGHPPDTNGDVGPEYFIQSINTSLGIFRKTTGARVAAFSFNTFMKQGNFGNLCDTNNFGDPVVVYDTFEDRWVVSDFAFRLDSGGNVVNPPGAFQCFAVSKTSDPVNGGWNFYSINTTGGLGDYPKLAIWPDGIYMSVNMFGYPNGAPFQGVRVFAFNKAQMYAGAESIQIVSFDVGGGDFTILPSNARLQAGTPPAGSPNYFVSTSLFLNALAVYKFHVDWDHISLSAFTGPEVPLAATSWPNQAVPNAPSLGGNSLDALGIRAMMQNQYSNIGGTESLWTSHTVRRATGGVASPRWYELRVANGVVAPTIPQAATWDPDGANLMFRFMPSLAVDRAGDMAIGYSTSNATTKPALKYAGRLAADPINTFSQTEQLLVQGTGTQTGNCGGSVCTRWGDYSAMTLDVDGCTFYYTNMYYKADGLNHQTFIGSFAFPNCAPIGQGTLQGTVRAAAGGQPLAGVRVALGSRTTLTDAAGVYSFLNLPAGTYPSISASLAGFDTQTGASIVVNELTTTVRDLSLNRAATAGCLVDTTKADFNAGVSAGCDLTDASGTVTLVNPEQINHQNVSVTGSGFGVDTLNWAGQTFVPTASGQITRIDVDLFCFRCTGTTPNIALAVRATDPVTQLPVGPDLGAAIIPGFNSGAAGFRTAVFTTPVAVTAATRYALVFHPIANPSAGTYAYVISSGSPYANGAWVDSENAGASWFLDPNDLGFKVFMRTGFVSPGTFVSSLKDANPAPGSTPTWGTLAWTAIVPDGTSLRFQAAASDSPVGPFAFVGPDGTAATFFANGASLSQFNGRRYLKYQVALATTDSAVSPILDDVTICFEDQIVTTLAVDPSSGTYGGTTTVTARLSGAGGGIAGQTIAFTLNGNSVGDAVTNSSGVATLGDVSIAGIDAGAYPGAIGATFAGGAGTGFTGSSSTAALTVTRAPLTAKADDKSKVLNAPNPVLTGSVAGLVNGDVITATYSTPAVTASVVGAYPIVPSLVDPGGRLANYDVTLTNGTLTVAYAANHPLLAPVGADGTRAVNASATVPVKFRVTDANGASIGTPGVVATFALVQIVQNGVTTNVNVAPQSTTGDSGFRWDPVDQLWLFNLSTKNLASGATYVYRVALNDGSAIVFRLVK